MADDPSACQDAGSRWIFRSIESLPLVDLDASWSSVSVDPPPDRRWTASTAAAVVAAVSTQQRNSARFRGYLNAFNRGQLNLRDRDTTHTAPSPPVRKKR